MHRLPRTRAGLKGVAQHDGFAALRTGRDHIDGTFGDVLKILEVTLGLCGKLLISRRAGCRAGPALERLGSASTGAV